MLRPERNAALTVLAAFLATVGELPVVENDDTSVLLGHPRLLPALHAAGFDVDAEDTDRQWDLYWDVTHAHEALTADHAAEVVS